MLLSAGACRICGRCLPRLLSPLLLPHPFHPLLLQLLLIHSPAPAFSPTCCCTPTRRWRVKLILPLFAALPLLVAYSGGTGIALPKPLVSLLGLSSSYLELGLLYKVWGGGCGERL